MFEPKVVTGRTAAVALAIIPMLMSAPAFSQSAVSEPPPRLAQVAPKPSDAKPPSSNILSFMIFFDYQKPGYSNFAKTIVDTIVEQFKAGRWKEVRIVGHVDQAEPKGDELSLARASAIRTALIAKGVPSQMIAIVGASGSQPLVPAAKGAKEPQNRRAEVLLVP